MPRGALVALLLVTVPLAGCIGSDDVEKASVPQLPLLGELLKPAETALWTNPQTTPHPMFNFPTLTHPATGTNVPALWQPIAAAPLPTPITGFELVAETGAEAESGAGMTVFGSLAVVPGYGQTTHIFDISDPTAPKLVGEIEEDGNGYRNVDLIPYPSGRLVAVFATNANKVAVWDITDPAKAEKITDLEPTTGAHKVNVVPGTPIVYNANSNGGAGNLGLLGLVAQPRTRALAQGLTEIFDLTDPENPVHVQDWKNGYGCHHIYFWNSPAESKYRAICAGIEVTQIWDIADPRNPVVIVDVPVHHGNPNLPSTTLSLESFSHFSILDFSGKILIVGDESGGGALPPGCTAHAEPGGRSVSGPLGAISFYDVSDEKNPKFLGWFEPSFPVAENPPEPTPSLGGVINTAFYSCTAHHGRLVPDPEGRSLLAMAFYRAGVVLVDFSDPANAKQVDQFHDGADTWEAQYYNGYVFTGDLARGMDVLRFR